MTATEVQSARPGLQVGTTSEFTLFFRVRPGHGEAIRQALQDLQNSDGYRPGDYRIPIAVIHEARFVLFDDDTRLLFATSFDGPWDAYMVDFASENRCSCSPRSSSTSRATRGSPTSRRSELHPECPGDGRGLRAQLPRHRQGDPKGHRVEEAFQRVLDDPGPRRRCAPRAAAVAGPGRGRASADEPQRTPDVRPHLRSARPGRPDRGHHRRLRVPEP